MRTVTKICTSCLTEFEAPIVEILGVTISPSKCDPCTETEWRIFQAKTQPEPTIKLTKDEIFASKASDAGFKRYLRFDETKLFPSAFRAWREIIDDIPETTGLLFLGPTSQGKTFVAVDIIRRVFLAGLKVRLVDGVLFGLEVGQIDSDRREREIKRAIAADWLLFDDLGKCTKTPRVTEALFAISKLREDAERPTIWTSNADGDELLRTLPGEFAEPFVERLRRSNSHYLFQ